MCVPLMLSTGSSTMGTKSPLDLCLLETVRSPCKVRGIRRDPIRILRASWWLSGKESSGQWRNTGNMGLIPGLGRFPEAENGKPLQNSCLENSMNRGATRSTAHGVAESDPTEHTCMAYGNPKEIK